jgi:hypothetical protein
MKHDESKPQTYPYGLVDDFIYVLSTNCIIPYLVDYSILALGMRTVESRARCSSQFLCVFTGKLFSIHRTLVPGIR